MASFINSVHEPVSGFKGSPVGGRLTLKGLPSKISLLSLIFSKIYLLGLGKPIAASYDKFCSSTENGSSSYPPYFGTVTATNLENYYETFMKTYETNKNINSKDEILLNLLNSEHQDEYKENKHTYFQPIRYFKSE